MDIVASIPAWLIETAQERPFALAFAVPSTVATVMVGIRILLRSE